MPHTELAEIVLDESGYTEMWQKDRSADAAAYFVQGQDYLRAAEQALSNREQTWRDAQNAESEQMPEATRPLVASG